MDLQALGGIAFAQALAQVTVELDDVQLLNAFKKWDGQRPEPGTDFCDVLSALRIDCSDDALDNPPINEKVLTQPLSRDVPGRRHCTLARCARRR